MAEIDSQGYDNPISLRKDNNLNRWSFAREVLALAILLHLNGQSALELTVHGVQVKSQC